MNNNWRPFGKNILFAPQSKNKIIGDTSKYWLYGKVLAIGDKVEKTSGYKWPGVVVAVFDQLNECVSLVCVIKAYDIRYI